MSLLSKLLGIESWRPAVTFHEMDERIITSSKNDQVACDVLNESRRKRGLSMLRCGEGLPSWEGALTDPKRPAWEDL